MPVYMLAPRLSPEASKRKFEHYEEEGHSWLDLVKRKCPEVKFLDHYAILGPWDYLDIFSAPDNETAMKVSSLIRTFGHARAEIWAATEWQRFKELMHELPAAAA